MKNNIARTLVLVALIALAAWIGRWSAPAADTPQVHDHTGMAEAEVVVEAEKPVTWTCPMHAQIRLPQPGQCPICGMDLVRLVDGEDVGPRRMAMSPGAVQLAGIRTTPVERRFVTRPVRMVGKFDYDETAVKRVAAWVPGRIERLFVDFTGIDVTAGQHLFELYSPELLTAQEELLSAKARMSTTADDASDFLRRSSDRGYQAARQKLLLWGLSEEQVAAVEERGEGIDRVTIPSPVSGTVIHKSLDRGAYVTVGTPVYTIADLTRLWVRLDAYEQDLPWLRFGQGVTLQVEALPGETFEGTVSFIDPIVNDRTRTAKVRVNVPNPDARLKPGMFVRAVVEARMGRTGAVVPPDLAGKWVSPMHPEIVKDGPGTCDVCGMALVPAEELSFARGDALPEAALVVPESAVLVTGKRAVVYVEVPGTERPTYEGREVLLGPRAGDEYVVRQGLQEGERVVTQGAFRIDSSMQIQAKHSMLSLPADRPGMGAESAPFRRSLSGLYDAYHGLQAALAGDDGAAALAAAAGLAPASSAARPSLLSRRAQQAWAEELPALHAAIEGVGRAEDLEGLRVAFEPLSLAMLLLAADFGVPEEVTWYEAFCPMAMGGRGAPWLQTTDQIANPYFGAAMLNCGEIRDTFFGARAVPQDAAPPMQDHAGHVPTPASDEGAPDAALLQAYLAVQAALAGDRLATDEELDALTSAAAESGDELRAGAAALVAAADLEAQRTAFGPLSQALLARVSVANRSGIELFEVHCPMAFDSAGASWVQAQREVRNPYFGSAMLTCGSVQRAFSKE